MFYCSWHNCKLQIETNLVVLDLSDYKIKWISLFLTWQSVTKWNNDSHKVKIYSDILFLTFSSYRSSCKLCCDCDIIILNIFFFKSSHKFHWDCDIITQEIEHAKHRSHEVLCMKCYAWDVTHRMLHIECYTQSIAMRHNQSHKKKKQFYKLYYNFITEIFWRTVLKLSSEQ